MAYCTGHTAQEFLIKSLASEKRHSVSDCSFHIQGIKPFSWVIGILQSLHNRINRVAGSSGVYRTREQNKGKRKRTKEEQEKQQGDCPAATLALMMLFVIKRIVHLPQPCCSSCSYCHGFTFHLGNLTAITKENNGYKSYLLRKSCKYRLWNKGVKLKSLGVVGSAGRQVFWIF